LSIALIASCGRSELDENTNAAIRSCVAEKAACFLGTIEIQRSEPAMGFGHLHFFRMRDLHFLSERKGDALTVSELGTLVLVVYSVEPRLEFTIGDRVLVFSKWARWSLELPDPMGRGVPRDEPQEITVVAKGQSREEIIRPYIVAHVREVGFPQHMFPFSEPIVQAAKRALSEQRRNP
jgi:hypothetical protein